jgi:hypothetical protein
VKLLARVLQRIHVAIKHSPFAILLDPLPIFAFKSCLFKGMNEPAWPIAKIGPKE